MSNSKFNNKTLLAILAIMIVIFVGTEMYRDSKRNAGNRLPEIVQMDTSSVSRILIEPNNDSNIEVIKESANQWSVSDGEKKVNASTKEVRTYLSNLLSVKPLRLISKTEDRWKDYSVTDSLALKVKVYEGNDLSVDLYVGRSRFNQSTGGISGYTYIRDADEVETYNTEGFISTNLNKNFNAWRNNQVLVFQKEILEDMIWTYPADSGFVLNQTSTGWKLDNAMADSAKTEGFIVASKNKVSRDFFYESTADYADPAPYQLKVNLKESEPIIIKAWPKMGEENKFILHSSLNEEAWFSSSKSGLFKQLFPPKKRFTL
jgi:hypothetical protein